MMKRLLLLLLVLLLVLPLGCTKKEPMEALRLGALKGPTAMGLVQLLQAADAGTSPVPLAYTIAGAADELTPKFIQGELDMLALPINAASILYNKLEGDAVLLCVNTLGVLYVVEKGDESVHSLKDLKGKTILSTGKGNTPEQALRFLLREQGLDMDRDVTMDFKSEPGQVLSELAMHESGIALLPEPYVTQALEKVEGLRVALDLSEEWDKLGIDSRLITAGLIVSRGYLEAHPKTVKAFLEAYSASTLFVNGHPTEAGVLVEQYIGIPATVAQQAIPSCHIVCIAGKDMQTMTEGYLCVLFEQDPRTVGGALPQEDFYYLP